MQFQFGSRRESRYRALCINKIEFSENISVNNSYNPIQKKTSNNKYWIADVTLLRTLSAYQPKVKRTKFLKGDRIPCFISISKFGRFKNPFTNISNLFEL